MADERRNNNVVLEDVRIMFRNFSGKKGQYNAEGDRNFVVLMNDDFLERYQAEFDRMLAENWNVKYLKPREEGDEPTAYLPIAVSFRFPPRIAMISSRGRTLLEESDISILDWAEIRKVDLIINPSYWDINGNQGVKAYLKSLYVTINEDELEKKYADVPDSAQNSIGDFGLFEEDGDE